MSILIVMPLNLTSLHSFRAWSLCLKAFFFGFLQAGYSRYSYMTLYNYNYCQTSQHSLS